MVITISQIAEDYKVNRKTVLRWIKEGKIKAVCTPGGHHRVLTEDYERFMETNQSLTAAASSNLDVKRIFIIDDDEDILDLFSQIVVDNFPDSKVITFKSGYEAMLEIGRTKPGIILLDLMMPKFDGFEVMKAIQAMNVGYKPKVVVISGHLDNQTIERLKTTIASGWLNKPVRPNELVKVITELQL
jgi:excisionase family DNA binding protein